MPGKLLGWLFGIFFALAGPGALFYAGWWARGDRPAWHAQIGLCPLICWRPGWNEGDGTALADLRAKEAAAGKRAVVVETRYVQVGQAVGAQLAQSQAKAARVNRGLHTYINQVLGDSDQRAFSLTVGVVRVFNASASGVDVSEVTDPAGRADDAPSGISAADAASVFADDGKACLDWRDREAGWRAWWAGVSAANNLPQP